jgi:hypothetical protein
MSTATGPVSLFRKPFASLPVGLWIPLLGTAWVFLNVFLLILGARDVSHPRPVFSLLAGAIDGGIFGSIAVATFSEKLHAGTAGLLSGYGFQDVLNNFKLTGQGVQWLHARLDPILDAVLGIGNEPLHLAIEKQVVWIGCTAAFVILATLVVELIRPARIKSAPGS